MEIFPASVRFSAQDPLRAVVFDYGGVQFEVRVLSCEVAEAKPEPAIFTLTAERLHLPPEGCLFVDNREPNIGGCTPSGYASDSL